MAIDQLKAFELEHGIRISDGVTSGPLITGGPVAPTGLDLPVDTIYVQNTASGIFVWKKFGVLTSEWRKYSAQDIPFDDTSFYSTDVKSALIETRDDVVWNLTVTNTVLNTTLQLTSASRSLQIIEGTATGFSVQLPNATTLFNGRKFDIVNRSSVPISLRNFDGSIIGTINAGDLTSITLRSNSTTAGIWLTTFTSIAAGVNAFNVVSSSVFSTTSATDVVITGMTNTPQSGTYGVWFSCDATIGRQNNLLREKSIVGAFGNSQSCFHCG